MVSIFAISTYDDIADLWKSHQNETLNLEFKKDISTDSKEIAKDISSFANAEGGVIVYGINEENGKAVKSNGIPIGQNSERIQQIISSSTSPTVPIEIMNISATRKGNSKPKQEFLVVKIPKSPFMIHQVTTTSKYYVRNNTITTSHIYQPFEMKENEIALRYENRFRAKQEQINFIHEKERKIAKEVGWNAYILISVVPHVRISDSFKITKEYFHSLFANSESTVIYNDLPGEWDATYNIPNYEGRSSDPHTVKREYFEIDNDRSIYFCIRLDGEHRINMYRPMFASGPILHLANRVLMETNYFGGATFKMNVNGSIVTERVVNIYDEIPTGGRAVSDFEIQHEMPSTPINVNDEYLKIFEKYFEALHIDNSLEIYRNSTIRDVFSKLAASEQRVQINKPSK